MAQTDSRRPDGLRTFGHSRAVRWDRYNYRDDAIIHLTICAETGSPFKNHELAEIVCDSIVRCSELRAYQLYGFCLMPDHLHVLLSPADSSVAVGKWLDTFKSFTTVEYIKQGGRLPLWQRSANDHVCRDGETAESVLRYIADNPVRKNLVSHWRDWPWTRTFMEI
ncbi:MAG: transposase [Nitrososphaera sp.]|nr:transposase [Nitrososphaera sp.]